MRVALEEINTEDLLRQKRGWKLFMLLPRMLLHRSPRGGLLRGASCSNDLTSSTEERGPASWRQAGHAACWQQWFVDGDHAEGRTIWEDAWTEQRHSSMGELSSARQALERCLTGSRFGRHSAGVEEAPRELRTPLPRHLAIQNLGHSSAWTGTVLHEISVGRDAEPLGVLLG